MIGRTLGHYRVDEQLGAGGMGEVYRARDARLERDVALKVLPVTKSEDPTARKRFRQEALALSRFNHPNIATIHDYDSVDGTDFLVMELVRGTPPVGPLSEKEVVSMGAQIAEGLAAAHGHGVLHRDLKPANLAMTPDGRVKILDFGLALLVRTTESSPTVFHDHGTAGTLAYMAPEQINGAEIDERADIYATGAVLYELATGRRAFDDPVPGQLIQAILTKTPQAPSALNPAISPALDRIILKALDKDPKRRYQSADKLLVDLREPAAAATADRAISSIVPRSRLPLVVGMAAVLIGLIAIALVVIRGRGTLFAARPPESIAVLRFENASGNPEDEVFSNAIGSDLIFQLMKSSSVRVTSGSSSLHVKRGAAIPDLARQLHVGKVIDGSVQRNGTRAVLNVHLYDGESGQELWTQVYDRAADDLSLVPSVALGIFDRLGVRLTTTERQRLVAAPQEARRVKAREACLQAVYLWQMRPPQLAKAKELIEKAIATDPTYARPYVLLAQYHAMLGMFTQTIPPMQFYPKAKELALQAIRMEQNDNVALSAAHGVLAMTKLHHEWDWQGAEQEFKKAIELNPSSATAHHWYAHLLLTLDRVDESLAESEKAAELDPLNVTWASCVGWHCLYARRYDRAVERSLEAVDMDPSAFSAHYYLGRAYQQKGRLPESIASFEQAVELSKGVPPAMSGLAYAYASAGRQREAEEILAKLTKRSQERYIPAYDFAVVYAGLGDKEKVFEWLEKAYLERSSWLVHVKWDERFERYRSDPRFTHLLRRIGVPV
jgi:serine/threonine protein kinase/Tfp pilus assembly protein PilF